MWSHNVSVEFWVTFPSGLINYHLIMLIIQFCNVLTFPLELDTLP